MKFPLLALLFGACLPLLSSGEEKDAASGSLLGRPRFSLAFSLPGDKNAKRRMDALNDESVELPSKFSCHFSGAISSDELRIGGGSLSISGMYYDPDFKCIFQVGSGLPILGKEFSFKRLPPGQYKVVVSVRGRTLYSKDVRLPLPEGEAGKFSILIPKAREFVGKLEGIPIFALESPIVGIGSILAPVDAAGRYTLAVAPSPDDKARIILRFPNKFQSEWEAPLYYYECRMSQGDINGLVNLPSFGDWKSAVGTVTLAEHIPQDFTAVIPHVDICVSSLNGSLVFRCSPDRNGRFLLIGLPDGRYRISVDASGNPPFIISEEKEIVVANRESEPIHVVLAEIR